MFHKVNTYSLSINSSIQMLQGSEKHEDSSLTLSKKIVTTNLWGLFKASREVINVFKKDISQFGSNVHLNIPK